MLEPLKKGPSSITPEEVKKGVFNFGFARRVTYLEYLVCCQHINSLTTLLLINR